MSTMAREKIVDALSSSLYRWTGMHKNRCVNLAAAHVEIIEQLIESRSRACPPAPLPSHDLREAAQRVLNVGWKHDGNDEVGADLVVALEELQSALLTARGEKP